MMSEQWPLRKLSEVIEIQNGFAFSRREYTEEGHFLIRIGNVQNGALNLNKPNYVVLNTKSLKFELSEGDLLISLTGNIGRVARVEKSHLPAALNQRVARMKLSDSGLINSDFLYYFLRSDGFRNTLTASGHGTAQKNVSTKAIGEIEIPVPPMEEQQRIVSILDEAFENIKHYNFQLQTKLDDVNGLFQSVFSAITEDSSTWENKTVDELLFSEKGSIRTGPFGSQLLHSEFVDEGIAVLGIDNAVKNEFRWGKRRFITEEKYSQLSRYTVKPGDVIITIMGTCGRCAIIPDDIPTAINTKHLCCITLDTNKCLPEYLHAYFLHHPLSLEYLNKMAKGSVMNGLNMGIVRKLPVMLPTISEQQKIIDKLHMFSNEIKKLEDSYQTESESQAELKQSILQEAFNGNLTKEITA